MISRHGPLVKFATYSLLGLLASGLRVWSPAEALVICSVAFAVDGLLTSVLLGVRRPSWLGPRVVDIVAPLAGLLLGRLLANFMGLD